MIHNDGKIQGEKWFTFVSQHILLVELFAMYTLELFQPMIYLSVIMFFRSSSNNKVLGYMINF